MTAYSNKGENISELVSVIMPVYNVKSFVVESIESILNQTYQNIELIIVDDCSVDGTYELIKERYSTVSNVKILRNKINSKIVVSLNKALSVTKGAYIARIDGDDIAMPDRIEKQMNYLLTHPDIDLVGCSLKSIDEQGLDLFNDSVFIDSFSTLVKLAPFGTPVSHIWLAKKSIYTSLNGYRFPSVEDYDFLLRMITSGYKFANIPDYFGMKIRIREGNSASVYGVSQRKAFNFVRNRYFERLKTGTEKQPESVFELTINSKSFVLLHRLSNKVVKKGLNSKIKVVKLFYYFVAVMLSPYQMQYAYHSIRKKLLTRFK